MDGAASAEFDSRSRSGWAKFSSLSKVLMKKDSPESNGLQLFDATVSRTILWCSETWKLTVGRKRK